jgi:hypothetical protein
MVMLLETWEKVTILVGVVLSVGLFSFLISRFTFKQIFSDNSHKRIRVLSCLTTLILTPAILYLIAYLVFTPSFPDLKDSVDGWEINTTYQVYPSKTTSIVDKGFKINSGENNVLIVSRELTPVVKIGQTEPRDLRSIRNLIIELSQTDTLVNPTKLGSSKILREILAFSPNYGTNPLDKEEKIEIKRIGKNRWEIISDLIDFQFKGEFSFSDSSRVINKYVDKW